MQKTAFWCFFGFGVVTSLLAFGGGFLALFRNKGMGTNAVGFLLLFLGASLAFMLGSLLFIKKKCN